ncbi:spore germination protein [Oceanobacillus luteolus]|uniref:Spore germination protein n=1 Tax=Oceanobacillus luteolus TaxID=1274358 RepID=A0ABW4HRU8_9BACI|nr:spore germination protein [Oceanobacillus luteolus]MCM3739609.1 spore germination protein [Oceanobacillus luteolus]
MRPAKKNNGKSALPMSVDQLKNKVESLVINSQDLNYTTYQQNEKQIAVFYIPFLIDHTKLEESLLNPLLSMESDWSTDTILSGIPLASGKTTTKLEDTVNGLNKGEVFLYLEQDKQLITYKLSKSEKRALERAETEAIVIGPQLAFTESMQSNLNVISWRLNTPDLAREKIMVGERNPKEARIIYLKSVANETDVNTMRQRLNDLKVDMIEDIHMLKQYILDNSTSVFPQYVATELVDRATYAVKEGKIIVLVEGSPLAMVAPSTFFSFFESTEDRYFHWNLSSFILSLRFLAAFVTLMLTPMYVAATTFHYELIPSQLLMSIGQSRAAVPFPPILEVIIIELVIELLREAGARLPTKVGQTIGIVGGVVVGTAAVQAGITSNILIILVTLSALASFSTPNYVMGNTLRFVRFPLIIFASMYGIIGIMFGICLLVIHLVRLESLGRPYLTPLYPLRLADFNKVFFRLPEQKQGRRFLSYRLKDKHTYGKNKATVKKDNEK